MWDLSSPTRDRTLPPAVEAWSLNYWTSREVPDYQCCVGCWEDIVHNREIAVVKSLTITRRPEDGGKQRKLLLFQLSLWWIHTMSSLDGEERDCFLCFPSVLISLLWSPSSLASFFTYLQTPSPIHFISMLRSLEKGWDVDLGSFRFYWYEENGPIRSCSRVRHLKDT